MSDRGTKSIWKFPLLPVDRQKVLMPVGARILSVDVQRDVTCIWAIVSIDETQEEYREFVVHGTGHPLFHSPMEFIGTVLMSGGSLVFHVFEVKEG